MESTDAAPLMDQGMGHALMHQMIPAAHQLSSQSPFVDSGVSLDLLANHSSMIGNSIEIEDDVFVGPGLHQTSKTSPEKQMITSISSSSTDSSSSSNTTIVTSSTGPKTPNNNNGLNRSKRTNFPKKEPSPESVLKTLDDGERFVRLICGISIQIERIVF